MNDSVLAFVDILSSGFWVGFFVFLRVAAFLSLLPAFGERTVSTRVKIALAIAFTVIVTPVVIQMVPEDPSSTFVLFLLSETMTGMLFGMGVRLFVMGLQTAGTIAAQSTSLSQILGNAQGDPIPAMGYILVVGALCLAVMSGLHVKAAELLILSYDLIPPGAFLSGSVVGEWGVYQVRRVFSLAFTLAAPFLILAVLYNLALGAINRAMPQLMVAFVGAPVITLGGLVMLFLAAPIMLPIWLEAVDSFMAAPMRISR